MISINNVTFKREGKIILKNINWNVNKGEHWCILGLNGSGKTTLLNIINGYLWPTSGKVEVLNQTFGQTNIPELRKKIGWVSSSIQQRFRSTDTVLSIVLSGKFGSIGLYNEIQEEDINRAQYLSKLLACDTFLHQKYESLSQGEQQRVLIARALMASPELLILDEPCTALDMIAREQFLQFIEKIANEPEAPTLIFVTHHVEEILPIFAHTLLLRNGEVFASGATKDILTESSLSAFFQHPISVQTEGTRKWITLKKSETIY